jgi:integration host factor subunit alpha
VEKTLQLLNNMTKADIARAMQERASLTMNEATDAVELVIATLKETLAEGKTVKFSGFGTFLVKKRGERKGRDLKTGEEIPVKAKWMVTFKASEQVKAVVDSDNLRFPKTNH